MLYDWLGAYTTGAPQAPRRIVLLFFPYTEAPQMTVIVLTGWTIFLGRFAHVKSIRFLV